MVLLCEELKKELKKEIKKENSLIVSSGFSKIKRVSGFSLKKSPFLFGLLYILYYIYVVGWGGIKDCINIYLTKQEGKIC